MREDIKITKVFKFDELSDKAKENALRELFDINVNYEWFDFVYEDAKNIDLKIKSFDLGHGRNIDGNFLDSAEETAHKIEKEHGDNTETFEMAKEFLRERDKIIETAEKDENGDFKNEYELDQKLDNLDDDFLRDLLGNYLVILDKEYEYLTSEEAIKETIEINNYEFTEDGKLY